MCPNLLSSFRALVENTLFKEAALEIRGGRRRRGASRVICCCCCRGWGREGSSGCGSFRWKRRRRWGSVAVLILAKKGGAYKYVRHVGVTLS